MIMPKDWLFLSNTDMIARCFVEQRCMRWMESMTKENGATRLGVASFSLNQHEDLH